MKAASDKRVPRNHPRYDVLMAHYKLEDGIAKKLTTAHALIAQGRGEVFDYMLGERTRPFAKKACRAAAALLLLAEKPILSVNGNTATLVPDKLISLAKRSGAGLEVNVFHDRPGRRKAITQHLYAQGAKHVYGAKPDANIDGLLSPRGKVDSEGILKADVVVVSLEDGDRAEILRKHRKKIVAIDLNPFCRTVKKANISVIDNVIRALPCIEAYVKELKGQKRSMLERILRSYDNAEIIRQAKQAVRGGKMS